jgi:23S rRNA (uracil1939-C5)-methyltransferase
MPPVLIESLDSGGRGIAHVNGKAIFIEGALPGETVDFVSYRWKRRYERARVTRVLRESASRTVPGCEYFGVCGGCAMQHLDHHAQVAAKQRALEDALWHIGRLHPETVMAPVHGLAWGYRHRARLSVRRVSDQVGVLVGFRERHSSHVADMGACRVLPARVSDLLVPLRAMIEAVSIRAQLPQIEIAVGDAVTVLILRVLEAPSAADERILRAFADAHGIQFWLQPDRPESARPFHPLVAPPLYYTLPEFDVRIHFAPTDFTQVNQAVNAILVRRAVDFLDPRPGERILDLFCGLGNFSLPIAVRGGEVIGVEGSAQLVARARDNALANGLIAQFNEANLFDPDVCASLPRCDKLLLDPPREGAIELVKSLGSHGPHRVVYVSCDQGTLARDAGVLVHTKGYRLVSAGIVNMFAHTAHVESMAVFER